MLASKVEFTYVKTARRARPIARTSRHSPLDTLTLPLPNTHVAACALLSTALGTVLPVAVAMHHDACLRLCHGCPVVYACHDNVWPGCWIRRRPRRG